MCQNQPEAAYNRKHHTYHLIALYVNINLCAYLGNLYQFTEVYKLKQFDCSSFHSSLFNLIISMAMIHAQKKRKVMTLDKRMRVIKLSN